MSIDRSFIKSILALYDELINNGVSLVYIGHFNHQIIKIFSAIFEEDMEKHDENRVTKKRVYHAMIETLQNMKMHSEEIANSSSSKGLFMIGQKNHSYYIISVNHIENKNIEKLENAIKQVNSATKSELKTMYKAQLKLGKISPKGGAGLGLIDIARKSDDVLHYLFLPVNEHNSQFVLRVEIDSHKYASNGN